jgi:hypothetical protein
MPKKAQNFRQLSGEMERQSKAKATAKHSRRSYVKNKAFDPDDPDFNYENIDSFSEFEEIYEEDSEEEEIDDDEN